MTQQRDTGSDQRLLRRLTEGDPGAERDLLRLVTPAMARVIRQVLGPSAGLEDVLQDACIEFLSAVAGFRGDSSLRRYAARIAGRKAVRARRKERVERAKVVHLDAHAERASRQDPYAMQEERELLRGLLDELPVEQAEALVMRIVLGHTLPEIAEASGAPVNTVRSRIRLAREALRAKLERHWGRVGGALG